MLENLLLLFRSTFGTAVTRLTATQRKQKLRDHCDLNQVVLLNFARTLLNGVSKNDVPQKIF